MTPEHLGQIEELYHSARERPADERAALLDAADPEVRREVESLLARQDANLPPLHVHTMTLVQSGARLGPYQIETKLGEGGMGEVFRGIDTRLGRPVAIKMVQDQFSARFEREARAISSLNHPHICTLYDIGPNYLVMELIEGQTLSARIRQGALPFDEVLRYGTQITEALMEAHAAGIVHRDLKPGNVMMTRLGVKVLDFGLAKLSADSQDTLTASNAVMGTPAYMAPEQVQGRPADARADLFALGLILYEMATGKLPFPGASLGAMLASDPSATIPPPSKVRSGLPPQLDQLSARLLASDPADRPASAALVRGELIGLDAPQSMGKYVGGKHAGNRRKIILAAAAALVIAVVSYFYFPRVPRLTDKDIIVLADFINTTGDPVFDETLRQGLAIQLEQSPFLSMLADSKIQRTLGLMGQPNNAGLTPALAQEVCERTGSAAVLEGSIQNLGSQYVIGLRAKNCRTGAVLADEQAQAAKKEDVLNALSQIATKFRTRVGESLATIQKYDTPLEEATTPSLEALKAYSAAEKISLSTATAAGAIPLFKRAVELDPKFAMAHANLGLMYSGQGESVLSAQSTATAYRLRDRVSDTEKSFIAFNYDRQVTGNLEKARQTLELWAQTYPRDPIPHGLLGGFTPTGTGQFELSIKHSKITIGLDPDILYGYLNLASANFYLDRLGEAEDALRRASERKLEFPQIDQYYMAFLKNDTAGMDRTVGLAKGNPQAEDIVSLAEALVLARSGQLQQAHKKSQHAVDLALQAQQPERAALFEDGPALWEALYGNTTLARKSATDALALSRGRDVEFGAAFALAVVGDSVPVQSLVDDFEKRFREDTSVQFNYLPALRARLSLNRREPLKAIEFLRKNAPYEFAVPGLPFTVYFGGLYPVYVRGEAYLASHQGAEAAVEFQKILDHRGIVSADPIGALAHLQLGRAFALSGDNIRAKAAYQEFLALWAQADEDIPVFRQAKAEYAKLP